MTRPRPLPTAAGLLALMLLVSSALLRTTGPEPACPRWPVCEQGVTLLPRTESPAQTLHDAGLVGLVLLSVVLVLRPRRGRDFARTVTTVGVTGVLTATVAGVQAGAGPVLVSSYLAALLLTLAGLLVLADPSCRTSDDERAQPMTSEGFALLATGAALAIGAVIVTGGYVTGAGAGLACKGWPLCNGEWLPLGERMTELAAFHRFATAAAAVLVAALVWRVWTAHRHASVLLMTTMTAAVLFVIEVMVGAGNAWMALNSGVRVTHAMLAAGVWCALVLTALKAFQMVERPVEETKAHDVSDQLACAGPFGLVRDTVAAYVGLTKPRIIELLLITTVPAMILAEQGLPSLWLIVATVIGGSLTAGGANAINCYIDRDIDKLMKRTKRRSLARERILPERALAFGIVIGLAGFVELAVFANLLSALLATSAILFYVFIYTKWLKRSTDQNIVIGGAAGAIPPLVGWAAVTGRVDAAAWILFAIIFLWTPPHFWALALRYRADYAAAGVPMLPVVRGDAATRRQILIYTVVLVAFSPLLALTDAAGIVYLGCAGLVGAWFLWGAWRVYHTPDTYPAMKLFHISITYLTVLFGGMVIDQVARINWL